MAVKDPTTGGGGQLPPQTRRSLAFSAAGGGFGGALLAIIVAKILQGPCCYQCSAPASAAAVSTAQASVAQVLPAN